MAGRLAALGVREGDRVAILAANSGRYIDALFAIPRLGAIATPLNTRLSIEEMAILVRDADAMLLLADDSFLAMAEALRANGAVPRVQPLNPSFDDLPTGDLSGEPSGERTAFILYTGGSTGRSKGVMHSSATLIANAWQSAEIIGDLRDMRFLYIAPLFHVGALAYTAVMAMHGGVHVPLATFDPDQMLRTIARDRVTHLAAVPTMLSRVIETPGFDSHDLSSLRRVIYGASPISDSLLRRAMQALPGAQFAQSYGQTETVTLTILPPEWHALDGDKAGKLKCAGRPTPGVDMKIIDDDGAPVPPVAFGEVVARSASIMPGYWNLPEATADTIRDGWIHTGDIGLLDEDGFLTLVDRKKDMIISGGENISSVEVEDALAAHSAVLECAVIGIADPDWGERVHAVVRLRDGMSVTTDDLIAHCRTRLAGYKCPRTLDIVTAALPLSGAGKVLKRELRADLNQQAAA